MAKSNLDKLKVLLAELFMPNQAYLDLVSIFIRQTMAAFELSFTETFRSAHSLIYIWHRKFWSGLTARILCCQSDSLFPTWFQNGSIDFIPTTRLPVLVAFIVSIPRE
jgi:hypothetical protein